MSTGALHRELVVVGAGASGLMAAIAAARAGAEVLLLEQAERVGKSILATGNGRCNLSNELLDEPTEASLFYNSPDFVLPTLSEYDLTQVIQLFGDMGLIVAVDERGLVFPRTNSAVSVLAALHNRLESLPVEVRTGVVVRAVDGQLSQMPGKAAGKAALSKAAGDGVAVNEVPADKSMAGGATAGKAAVDGAVVGKVGERLALSCENLDGKGEESLLFADAVILSCGPSSLLQRIAGHECQPLRAALGPLKCSSPLLKGLDGVRVKARATLQGACGQQVATGELHFRTDGLSGIMIFDLSRFAAVGDTIIVDLFSDLDAHELANYLEMRLDSLDGYHAQAWFDGLLHPRLAAAVLRVLDCSPAAAAATIDTHALAHLLKALPFKVSALPTSQQGQVHRGGLLTHQFDPTTLASLLTPALYACGEALNIDGACGGYNLHWAWASGYLAGLTATSGLPMA